MNKLVSEKTYLRKIRKVVKYWFDDKCPKCGGETIEPDEPMFPKGKRHHSFDCLKCGFQLPSNHNSSYIDEIDRLAKEGLKL